VAQRVPCEKKAERYPFEPGISIGRVLSRSFGSQIRSRVIGEGDLLIEKDSVLDRQKGRARKSPNN